MTEGLTKSDEICSNSEESACSDNSLTNASEAEDPSCLSSEGPPCPVNSLTNASEAEDPSCLSSEGLPCPVNSLTSASTSGDHPWVCEGKLAPGVIVVGLGGNIGGQESTAARLHSAIGELSSRFGQARVSSLYCSSPVGPVQSQPDFVNAVAAWKLEGEFTPESVLAILQEVENSFGRVRETKGGARTLDLDLLYFGTLVRDCEELLIPHPRILSRAFVVVPLIELFSEEFVAQGSTAALGDIRNSPSLQSQGLRLYSL